MKKIKSVSAFILIFAILFATFIPVFAWENIEDYGTNFTIDGSGNATVGLQYIAKPGEFNEARVSVKIKKRVLGIFWDTVEIGYPDNEWVAYGFGENMTLSETFALEATGTYHAIFNITFYGTDGSTDEIEETLEAVYR